MKASPVLVLLVLLALSTMPCLAQTKYSVTEIVAGGSNVRPTSINASDNTVGTFSGGVEGTSVFYLEHTNLAGSAQTLDPSYGTIKPYINNKNLVTVTGGQIMVGTLGVPYPLTNQPVGVFGATGVTDSGYTGITTSNGVYRWNNGVLTLLSRSNAGGVNFAYANAANNIGTVVGAVNSTAAYWLPDSSYVQVGQNAGYYGSYSLKSELIDVNAIDQFLKRDFIQPNFGASYFVTSLGSPTTNLQQLPFSNGVALNDQGSVIGTNTDGDPLHPAVGVLYQGGVVYRLLDLLQVNPGWSQLTPTALSKYGTVVGVGVLNGRAAAFIMKALGTQDAAGNIDYVHQHGDMLTGYFDGLYSVALSNEASFMTGERNNGLFIEPNGGTPYLDKKITAVNGIPIADYLAAGNSLPAPITGSNPLIFTIRLQHVTNLQLDTLKIRTSANGNIFVQLHRIGN